MSAAVLANTATFTAPACAQTKSRLRRRVAKILADRGVAERAEDARCSCSKRLANAPAYGRTGTVQVDMATAPRRRGGLPVSARLFGAPPPGEDLR